MNLKELYKQTASEKHSQIRVSGGRAFVQGDDGSLEVYSVADDGELFLVFSDKAMREALAAIRARLGA